MVKPITPDQVADAKAALIPDMVIEAFNFLIAKHFLNGSAEFTILEVIDCLREKGMTDAKILKSSLDVKYIFEKHRWEVKYDIHDSPRYSESYVGRFTFKAKR